jgi:hypothetical protein
VDDSGKHRSIGKLRLAATVARARSTTTTTRTDRSNSDTGEPASYCARVGVAVAAVTCWVAGCVGGRVRLVIAPSLSAARVAVRVPPPVDTARGEIGHLW